MLIISIIALSGCAKKTYSALPAFDYNKSDNPWISAYKDQAFIACLKESYKNDSIFKIIERYDAGNPYDGIYGQPVLDAKKLGAEIAKNIPSAQMCEGCTEEQNYFMATCLHYYNSKELDSIARAAHKKYNK